MEQSDIIETNRELRELRNEKILREKVLKAEQEKMLNLLKGEMGNDMQEVLSGKKIVKLSRWERFKHKLNYYIIRFLRAC